MQPILFANLQNTYAILIWPHKYTSLGYYVYRKVNNGSFTLLNNDALYVNFYKDVVAIDARNTYTYKVTYIDALETEQDYTAETQLGLPPGRTVVGAVFPALHYISNLSFQLGKAENCTVLVRPQVGTKCPDCYNVDTQDLEGRWCNTCENTSFVNGYVRYDNVLVRFSNQGQKIEQTDLGYELRETISCQVLDYPLVQDKDIIVRPTGERYFVNGDVRKIQLQSLLLKQIFNVKEILVNTEYYAI